MFEWRENFSRSSSNEN